MGGEINPAFLFMATDFYAASFQDFGFNPSSYMDWISTQMLWHSTLHRA